MNDSTDASSSLPCTPGLMTDAKDRHEAEERVRLAARVFEGTSDGILVTDARGRIVDVNEALLDITGYGREQLLGQMPTLLFSGAQLRGPYCTLCKRLAQEGGWRGEIWARRADGALVLARLRISALYADGGELTHYVALLSDVTENRRQKEALQRQAYYDVLTGLPNRNLAQERLAQYIAAAGARGQAVAVCCVDLDGFMPVNSRLGRRQGDVLLTMVAERLRSQVRVIDCVARIGGDEFVLLLRDLKARHRAGVASTLQRVQQALGQPYALQGCEPLPGMTASIGVALFPEHGSVPKHLLRAADQAMYRAKSLGPNRCCYAGEDGSLPSASQTALFEDIRRAIDHDELRLHYQPKVCAVTRKLLGAEALVRWQHPQRGLLLPGAFLPALSGTALETELDLWVISTAVAQWARWHADGQPIPLSINISPGTLALPHLADSVAALMNQGRHAGSAALGGIELEVVETAALDDLESANRTIRACARHGISIALDDFGTGYSSLSYLRRLPVNTLKIDRSFVSNMLADPGDMHIVKAVIGLARAFGVSTVAEGVETAEHARVLAQLGCHQLQGFGIARPMPADALAAWSSSGHAGG